MFRKENKVAVKDVSFEVESGEMIAFLGPNGAGKSTIIKMLCGIILPNEGEIIVNNMNPYKNKNKFNKTIGVVLGNKSQLLWDLPFKDSINLFRHLYELDDYEFKNRLREINAFFSINDLLNIPVRNMSLGMRTKCEIVASILHKPKTLFLDEPTIGLDVTSKKEIRELVIHFNREYNTTVFLTSHDMSDVEALCNRVIIINNGSLILDKDFSYIHNNLFPYKKIYLNMLDCQMDILEKIINKFEVEKWSMQDNELMMLFNKNIIDEIEILIEIQKHFHINNLRIEETNIENIIEKLYLL